MKMKQKFAFALSFCLLVGLLFVVPVNTALAAENLASNGDLELGSTTGWEISNASISSSIKYAGNYSLKLTATSAYSGAAYKIVPVRKNATVTVSFYYRYDSNPGSGKTYHVYTYQGTDASAGAYSGADKSFAIPSGCTAITTWQQISYTFNSGNYNNIYLKFCPGGSGSSTCYIDNLVVTAEGGDEERVAPYLNSFGTKYNRPQSAASNLIKNGGFESTADAQWNATGFLKGGVSVVSDNTAPEGEKSLYFNSGSTTTAAWYTFPVTVEKSTQYTFSAWVKSPRLSAQNKATATFGVVDPETGKFLTYEPYMGTGYGTSILSSETMQLMATSPDDEWHLRSVTFYSGTATTVNVAIYGAQSQLYLDDIALYKSSAGVEYISALRTAEISYSNNTGNKYCVDEVSLIPNPHMTSGVATEHWSGNPAWRNGFLSFEDLEDGHKRVLKYTASARPLSLTYVDWIDVEPDTNYTLTLDVKRLSKGDGRIALLDDNILAPEEFYTISFNKTDSDWQTYSITFNSSVYSRVGFAIVDGGGSAYIDKTRLFKTADAVAEEPEDKDEPSLKVVGGETCVMEMTTYTPINLIKNGDLEDGWFNSWDAFQSTDLTAQAAHTGANGAHLKGDGSWGALLEQKNIPVEDGATYTFTYWYKANSSGSNITLLGATTGTKYAYDWVSAGGWTQMAYTFTVEGDTSLVLNACGGGNGIAEDLYMDSVSLYQQGVGPELGVAFMMNLEAIGATYNEQYIGDLTNATADIFGDGQQYKLVEMGAVMTNWGEVGTDPAVFKRDYQDERRRVVDVPAKRFYDVTDTTVTYAVRIVEIPYYVFEMDGEEVVVYGDIYRRSYNRADV